MIGPRILAAQALATGVALHLNAKLVELGIPAGSWFTPVRDDCEPGGIYLVARLGDRGVCQLHVEPAFDDRARLSNEAGMYSYVSPSNLDRPEVKLNIDRFLLLLPKQGPRA